jgi:hypothetical protein
MRAPLRSEVARPRHGATDRGDRTAASLPQSRPQIDAPDFATVAVSPTRDGGGMQADARHEREADRIGETLGGLPRAPRSIRNDPLSARIAPAIVGRVAGWSGRPLDADLRDRARDRLGGDFGDVRIHTGPAAASAAAAVSARAFTHGHDIVFGAGQYAPQHAQGRTLLTHELGHVAQQRAGAPVLQCDVVDDVREKMSYAWNDWAITDTEAVDSLALLSTIPPADLAAALSRLGAKYVNRLLDNLPDSAKTGDAYKRVIEALGSAGTMEYATDQLSLGFFDWAVTDAEVSRVFNIFVTLPVAEQEKLLLGLQSAKKLARLLDNASAGSFTLYIDPWLKTLPRGRLSAQQRGIVRTIVEEAPNNPVETLMLATRARYDVDIGPTIQANLSASAVNWTGPRLRETYLILDHLPEAHVSRNQMLTRFGQFNQPQTVVGGGTQITGGSYSSADRELAINTEDPTQQVTDQQGNVTFRALPADDRRNRLQNTALHETGHAVDAQIGWSTGPEPAKPERGGWKTYEQPDLDKCATDMVDDAGGAVKTQLDATQRADVIVDMTAAMNARNVAGLVPAIRAHAWFAGLTKVVQDAVLKDQAVAALGTGLQGPWFLPDGGTHLGTHVYQDPQYSLYWVRYEHQARSRMLRDYQFRDIAEWFAECYAWYYTPDTRGIGQKLRDKDANTADYFRDVVDKIATSR